MMLAFAPLSSKIRNFLSLAFPKLLSLACLRTVCVTVPKTIGIKSSVLVFSTRFLFLDWLARRERIDS